MSIQIDCHGESHVGKRRETNEDQFLIADLNKSMRVFQTSLGLNHQTRLFGGSQGKLLLVADGLGGHNSGERASTLAVDGITNYVLNAMDWVLRLNQDECQDLERHLREALIHCQEIVQVEAEAIPQRRGMATTLTMAYVDWPQFYFVHVGDTRCYHVHDNSIQCLTTDHTIGELTRTSQRPSSEKKSSAGDDTQPPRSMNHALYNVIGGKDKSLDPQVGRAQLELGDSLLLCSDGLTRYLSDEQILRAVCDEEESAEQICQFLIEESNRRGGEDNITVVLAKFCEHSPENLHEQAAEVKIPSTDEQDTAEFAPAKPAPRVC